MAVIQVMELFNQGRASLFGDITLQTLKFKLDHIKVVGFFEKSGHIISSK